MKKVTTLVLMLCLILSGAYSYAYGAAKKEIGKGKGTPNLTILKAQHGSPDKSGSIFASIDGHVLSIMFSENLGQVTVEVSTTMAKVIMTEAYGYRYPDCPSGVNLEYPVRGFGQTGAVFSDEDIDKAMGFSINMSPNPARTWVAIDYTLPIGSSKALIRIADIYGKSVATYCLQGTESQKVLDLRDFVPGVYTYTVSCGKLSQTGKLVIVK